MQEFSHAKNLHMPRMMADPPCILWLPGWWLECFRQRLIVLKRSIFFFYRIFVINRLSLDRKMLQRSADATLAL